MTVSNNVESELPELDCFSDERVRAAREAYLDFHIWRLGAVLPTAEIAKRLQISVDEVIERYDRGSLRFVEYIAHVMLD